MRLFYRAAPRVCPALALIFSVIVTTTTMYMEEGMSPILIYLCIQVYLNWYCIYSLSRGTETTKSLEKSSNSVAISMRERATNNWRKPEDSTIRRKYWYCEKCCYYTSKPSQHCPFCQKCFHYRDHHCFFLGCCIIRENMGNFILICFYTSLACFYSLIAIIPHLHENINRRAHLSMENLSNYLNFCFPVALAKFFIAGEETDLSLVILVDTLFSVFFMCGIYGGWKLYNCISGKQRYYPHVPKKQDLKEIFGNYGLKNFLFPYNGLLGGKNRDDKYELKQV